MTQQLTKRSEIFIESNGVRRPIDDNEWNLFLKQNQESTEIQKVMLTQQRNAALGASDWVVQRSMETGQSIPKEWVDYRQALRDLTKQEGFPDSVVWPEAPKSK